MSSKLDGWHAWFNINTREICVQYIKGLTWHEASADAVKILKCHVSDLQCFKLLQG